MTCAVMGGPLADKADAVKRARETVEELLQKPEWLLDPGSKEARKAADEARSFLKDFFESVPPSAGVSASGALVVAGFDCDQIWEELEVQNLPVRRHLRKFLPRVREAEGAGVDVSLISPLAGVSRHPAGGRAGEQGILRPASRTSGGVADLTKPSTLSEIEAQSEASEGAADAAPEDFFDEEEMGQFMDLGDQGKLRLDLDAGESDFGELEAEDDEGPGSEVAKGARYADFFLLKQRAPAGKGVRKRKARSRGEEAERSLGVEGDADLAGLGKDKDGELSEEERELEEALDRLRSARGPRDRGAGGTDQGLDMDDEQAEEESQEADGEEALEEEAEEEVGDPNSETREGDQSLYEMDRQLRALEEEVVKLEQEQLEAKPWTLQGEVSAKQRPLNSLLEVHLDQPMTHFAGRRSEDMAAALGGVEGEEGTALDPAGTDGPAKPVGIDIEAIIRQRVWDETFDDVVRKSALPPSKRAATAEEDTVETLNFEKSRVGLGEVYAQKYEAEMLGHTPEAKVKEAKEKTEAKAAFAKLMHKLDLLTNAHFTPRPPMLGASGEQLEKVASLKMEETIPLLASEATLKAPEELRAPQRHARGREELSREERAASRRLRKNMRRRKLGQRVEAGELSLKGLKEREAHLASKNLKAKEERARQGEVRDRQKRLKASDLLAKAAENAVSQAHRKEDARQERRKRPSSTQSSQRLKL